MFCCEFSVENWCLTEWGLWSRSETRADKTRRFNPILCAWRAFYFTLSRIKPAENSISATTHSTNNMWRAYYVHICKRMSVHSAIVHEQQLQHNTIHSTHNPIRCAMPSVNERSQRNRSSVSSPAIFPWLCVYHYVWYCMLNGNSAAQLLDVTCGSSVAVAAATTAAVCRSIHM